MSFHWITQLVLIAFIRLMVIYQVDSVIHLLNNQGQAFSIIVFGGRCNVVMNSDQ